MTGTSCRCSLYYPWCPPLPKGKCHLVAGCKLPSRLTFPCQATTAALHSHCGRLGQKYIQPQLAPRPFQELQMNGEELIVQKPQLGMRFRKFPFEINRPNDLVRFGFGWHNIIGLLSEKSGPNCHDLALKDLSTDVDDSGTSELLSLQVSESTQEYKQADGRGTGSHQCRSCVRVPMVW